MKLFKFNELFNGRNYIILAASLTSFSLFSGIIYEEEDTTTHSKYELQSMLDELSDSLSDESEVENIFNFEEAQMEDEKNFESDYEINDATDLDDLIRDAWYKRKNRTPGYLQVVMNRGNRVYGPTLCDFVHTDKKGERADVSRVQSLDIGRNVIVSSKTKECLVGMRCAGFSHNKNGGGKQKHGFEAIVGKDTKKGMCMTKIKYTYN